MDALAHSLARSPDLFPVALDGRSGAVAFLPLSEAAYAGASFLDSRILTPHTAIRTWPWAEIASAVTASGLTERVDFIFHIGHVGSTLLSRLLGRHPAIFAIREPEILRMLALTPPGVERDQYLGVFLKLWSRTFNQDSRSVIKATSFVSEIAPDLLARPSGPRALMMGVRPESYLATILGAPHSPSEARMLAPQRMARLNQRLGTAWRTETLGVGEIVALGWACEASALVGAIARARDRVHVLDFDRFLHDPPGQLASAFAHFQVAVTEPDIRAVLTGPDMTSYSKAPEHAYDAALRNAVLDDGRREFATEIRRGLDWIARAAGEHKSIAEAVALFG